MELTDEGATVYLQDKHGATFPLVIDEAESKQHFKAHTGELLEAGDYKLVVKSRAGDAEGPLQTASRRVKYLRVVDPEPMPIAQSASGDIKIMEMDAVSASGQWDIRGLNVGLSNDVPPGEYVADLTFQRVGGSEGGEEIVAHDVTITVP